MEAGRGGRSRRREAKGGAYEEIAKLSQAKDKDREFWIRLDVGARFGHPHDLVFG